MTRFILAAILGLLGALPAYAAAPGQINSYVGSCNPWFPKGCEGAFVASGAASLAVSNVTGAVALPASVANAPNVVLRNTGTNDLFFKLGTSAVTAATTDFSLPAGQSIALYAGASTTYVAAITASSTTTLKVLQGSGIPAMAGGGGTSGGGGGPTDVNITEVGGNAVTTEVPTTDATTHTDLGAPGATACATDTGSCVINALLQRLAQNISSLISSLGGTNTIGAAPVTTVVVTGSNGSGATGGLTVADKKCDSHAKYDASDTGRITLVTGVSGRKIYVCSYILATGGTALNLSLNEGSDANCATNNAALTPVWQLVANDKVGIASNHPQGLQVSTAAYYICVSSSGASAHQAEIWYTIQ